MNTGKARSCRGKVRHATHESARRHFTNLSWSKADLGLLIYRCRFCNGFHIGHPGRNRQKQLKYERLLRLIERANEGKKTNETC